MYLGISFVNPTVPRTSAPTPSPVPRSAPVYVVPKTSSRAPSAFVQQIEVPGAGYTPTGGATLFLPPTATQVPAGDSPSAAALEFSQPLAPVEVSAEMIAPGFDWRIVAALAAIAAVVLLSRKRR